MEQHRLYFKASNGYPSSCQVTIYQDIQVVVVSKTGEGMSITNAAEIIATQVVKQFGLDPKRMLFIDRTAAADGRRRGTIPNLNARSLTANPSLWCCSPGANTARVVPFGDTCLTRSFMRS